jgi:hypothetical protein
MPLWRDTRHPIEREADLRNAAARTRSTLAASGRLDAVLTAGITEGKRVNKLAEAADRIKRKKLAHDAKGDEWLKRLDAIDAREPEAFAAGDAAIEEREVDLADMEATVRALSNLPNGSGKS